MIVIHSGRQPHEVLLSLVCVLIGLGGFLAFDRVSSNTVQSLGELWGRGLYLVSAVGGLITLAGVFWRGIRGPLIERSGLIMLAFVWFAYGIAVLALAGGRGMNFALFVGGFAAANLWRFLQIAKELKQVKAAAVITGLDLSGER